LSAAEPPAVLAKSCVLAVCAIALLGTAIGVRSLGEKNRSAKLNLVAPISRADQTDSDLTSAAKAALGNREGTIIVMDPRTGRIRAVVNPQIAFESAFAPGSTIKPFSTLAALRSGTIAKDSRMLCREHYSHADLDTVCSHPRNLPPLKPAEALAYSCNYYFGKLSEQVSDSTLRNTLAEFGFGQPTKVHLIRGREVAGTLEHGPWRAQTALGEGAQIEISPIQLLTAYSALANGGHLFVPQLAPEERFVAEQQKELSIDEEHRRLILEGMRGAVRYGTAERAKLYSLPLYIIGKTGTATLKGRFRTHGWFVGFASPVNEASAKQQEPDLAVIVFLKRAHGADAAEIARPIFESFIGSETRELVAHETIADQSLRQHQFAGKEGWFTPACVGTDLSGGKPPFPTYESGQPQLSRKTALALGQDGLKEPNTTVRVHLVRENVARTMPLESYILGVVAAEGSTETEVEALKALALTSRTYAVKNLRRHETDGYDFCTTTHCQRYVDLSSRTNASQIQVAASQAVSETSGQVLHDNDGRIVDAYFSASCGGATANLKTIWGTAAPYYLAGTSDEYCLTMPHHSWTDIISAANLLRALENDPRTEVGGRLTSVTVAKRDASGRAELITVDGARRRTVKGWDFKIIVGRALGWNLLKSSRFEVFRSGSNFVFRGSGFGHGLGLCQEGAHVMARRGAGFRQILSKYFPGTSVVMLDADGVMGRRGDGETRRLGQDPSPDRLPLTSKSSLSITQFTGQEGWFTTAQVAQQVAGGKPPFPTCEFVQLERSRPGSRHQKATRFSPTSPPRIMSHHAVSASLSSQLSRSLRVTLSPHPRVSASSRLRVPASPRQTLSSEHFEFNYPARLSERDVEYALRVLESQRTDLVRRVLSSGISLQLPRLKLFINDTTGDFVARTGQPSWVAAATVGRTIELQPLELLKRRRVVETTLRHELVHAIVEEIGHGRTPRWLAEGLALHLAGEGQLISRSSHKNKIEISELEHQLTRPSSADQMRTAYAAAYNAVMRLIQTEGESSVWRRTTQGS
jgi:stage II sporulation protein D